MVTTQGPVPVHPPPDQPIKLEPTDGEAFSVTTVPTLYVAEHCAEQLIVPSLDVTNPVPVPANVTVNVAVDAVTPVPVVVTVSVLPVLSGTVITPV